MGREKVIDSIERTFASGARIVTVLGPGGMGKTRLLYKYAECKTDRFLTEGGVWFVDLTLARDADDLCRALASAVGVRLSSGADHDETIAFVSRLLSELGSVLLLCDNFEQMTAEAAAALARWCAEVPALSVLVSSRRRLAIAGETVIELEPLSLGDASEGVQLFLDRAREAGHAVDPSQRDAVAALVRELEGIPLAIELAAARARIASPSELLTRLSRGDDLLSTPGRASGTDGVRLRSLRSAIERSWSLLADWEACALAQCAYFSDDFSLSAAEAVFDLSEFPDAPPVIDAIAALRDQSLLARREVDGATRFRLYASLRDFARERLAFDLAARVSARHRRYFLRTAVDAAEAWWRTGDLARWRELDAERENLLLIFRSLNGQSARSVADEEELAQIVCCLEPSMSTTASIEELLSTLEVGIESARRLPTPRGQMLLGRLLVARGSAHGVRGDNERSLADLERARDIGAALGVGALEADALVMSSVRMRQRGDVDGAIAVVTRAATLIGPEGEWPRVEGACAVVLGLFLCEVGRAPESRRANLRARAIFREAGDAWSEALALANVAQLDQAAGDFDAAERGFDAAIAIFRAFGDRRYEGRYLGYRAALDHERGRFEQAVEGYRHALQRSVRLPHTDALWRACLGAALVACGDLAAAEIEFGLADAMLGRVDAPMLRAAMELHRAHLDLARSSDPRATEAKQEFAERSEDVRFALRLLERARAHAHASGRGDTAPLWVGPGARWFQRGSQTVVDLDRRGSLHRILDWLVDQRLKSPGSASDWQSLLERGWPNERVLVEAGATRVRVAIATLRKLGLSDILSTRDDGYLLTEKALVERRDNRL